MDRSKLFNAVLLFCCVTVWSQQTLLLNHAVYDPMLLSPAAAGLTENLNVSCHYKKNWTGMPESPELSLVNLSWKPLKTGLGLGASVASENAGIFSRQSFKGVVAYRVALSSRQNLSFGIAGGFQRQGIDFDAIHADAPAEFAGWPQQLTQVAPHAEFGLAYTFAGFRLTGSANHLLAGTFRYETNTGDKQLYFRTLPVITLAAQQKIVLKKNIFGMLIHVAARSTEGLPVQPDLYCGLEYKSILFFGGGYRYALASYALFGIRLSEKVRLMYAFEHSRGIQYAVKGGHELSIQIGAFSSAGRTSPEDHKTREQLEEIFSQLDRQEAEMEKLKKRADSVDKNTLLIREELAKLKAEQLSKEELIQAIDQYFDLRVNSAGNQQGGADAGTVAVRGAQKKYRFISPKTEADFEAPEDTVQAGYKLVLGVYQLAGYARQYQQVLRREARIETKLVQLPGHPRNYIYVCITEEYASLKNALHALKTLRAGLKQKQPPLTKGEAWILQTVK